MAHGHLCVDIFAANILSVETLATVVYGDMHPATVYGHRVASAEIFLGMISVALIAGVLFELFSRPRASSSGEWMT